MSEIIILADNAQYFSIYEEVSKKAGVKLIFVQSKNNLSSLLQMLQSQTEKENGVNPKNKELIRLSPTVEFDVRRHQIRRGDQQYPLSNTEYKILKTLSSQLGIPYNSNDLIDNVWGIHSQVGLDSLYVHIRKIREKIEDNPSHPQLLINHYGYGYVLRALDKVEAASYPCTDF